MPEDQELSRQVAAEFATARTGEGDSLERLASLLYARLRGLARLRLRQLRPGGTLQTTALVHELYVKLADATHRTWQDRNHFLHAAAIAMRHILVDEARRQGAQRRGGDLQRVTLGDVGGVAGRKAVEILDLERALAGLASLDERLARIVELRFYGGMTVTETATAMELSERTVKRDWRKARAFLHREMESFSEASEVDSTLDAGADSERQRS